MMKLRSFKVGIVLGLLLFSMFAAFVPNASAGLIKVKPLITVTHPPVERSIIPNSRSLIIPLNVSFTLTGLGAPFIEASSLLKESVVEVGLTVEDLPDFIKASIGNQPVKIPIRGDSKDIKQPYVKITVTEKAPAQQIGKVTIRATSKVLHGLLFDIAEETSTFDVPFMVGYWPVVKILPRENFKQVGPLDTANFAVDIENLGNGPTYVAIEVTKMPEGWTVSVPSSVTLGSGVYSEESNVKATVNLVVKPPYGFGFHNDRGTFEVQFTPYYLGMPEFSGTPEKVLFNVQSVGMSTGTGFEIPLIVTVLVIIAIVFYLYKKSKSK